MKKIVLNGYEIELRDYPIHCCNCGKEIDLSSEFLDKKLFTRGDPYSQNNLESISKRKLNGFSGIKLTCNCDADENDKGAMIYIKYLIKITQA